MIESDAKQKWCPFVRVTVTPNDNAWQGNMLTNRGDIPASNQNTLCIGSACAVWVETDNEYLPRQAGDTSVYKGQPAGFCGLTRRD